MVTSNQCLRKYGDPALLSNQQKHLRVWIVPEEIRASFSHVWNTALGAQGFPKKIYLNHDLQRPLETALNRLIVSGLAKELKTWDGCFVIRTKRGLKSPSLHSWAIAIDVNAQENGLGKKPVLSADFVNCFTSSGFDWGGVWSRPDGMHFQLSSI